MAKTRGVAGVITDEDGVVCVPQDQLAAVDAAVQERIAKEQNWHSEIQRTRAMILKDTVDELLATRSTQIDP
jgi:regulator of RNase E activity RraA